MERLRGGRWAFVGALAALLVAALILVPGSRPVSAQEGAAVSIVDFAFEPATVEVAAGTTVTWTNNGAAPHTVTADDGAFDSGELAPGASFSQTFDTAGTFSYFCAIHPQMVGSVVVAGAEAAAPAAEEAAPAEDEAAVGAAAAPAPQLPATGVGTMALERTSSLLALLVGLGATALGLAAVRAYRRA